jgi:hypothetical protein
MALIVTGQPAVQTYSGQSGLVLADGLDPQINPSDTIQNPIAGSYITCSNGVDPTGGGATLGGVYLGNGTSWVLQGSLQNIPFYFMNDTLADTAGKAITAHVPTGMGKGWQAQSGDTAQVTPIIDAAGSAVYGAGPRICSAATHFMISLGAVRDQGSQGLTADVSERRSQAAAPKRLVSPFGLREALAVRRLLHR